LQDGLPGSNGESKNLATDSAIPTFVEGRLKYSMLLIMINIYLYNAVTCHWFACLTLAMDAELKCIFLTCGHIFNIFIHKFLTL
jgi:hypothetical protein